ncbi:MAG: hypothetical protein SGI96_18735 [Bacteroidota bacterium]|nr:hypothetical protein [Bacteroidota bacterium]
MQSKTEQELIDIYINPDEYQRAFVNAAEEELRKRDVNLALYNQTKAQKQLIRKKELEKGKPGDPVYIILAFISSFLGGSIGIVAGYVYSQSKNEERFYVYNEETRIKGKIMLATGILVLLATLGWKFL